MDLPPDLRAALDEELAPYAPRALAKAAGDLSRRYRDSAETAQAPVQPAQSAASLAPAFIRSDLGAAAYAAFRLPATYAAIAAAFTQARARRPTWRPQTLLDLGAGSGAALWAALSVWPDLAQATLLERDARMIALGRRLAQAADSETIQLAEWRRGDMTAADDLPAGQYDLVTVGYALGELRAPQRAALVARLWEQVAVAGALAIVEPGTPSGYAHMLAARDALIAAGATIVAPCPHNGACPMAREAGAGGARDWCHFAQRLPRSRLHRQVKGGALAYEDEKFAYVIAAHLADQSSSAPAFLIPTGGRVVRHPQIHPGVITAEVCAPEGRLRHETWRKRDRATWRLARDLRWGDALPPDGAER